MDPLLGRTDPGRTGERELGRKEPEPGGLGVFKSPEYFSQGLRRN
jgi:hypothetical protein